MKITFLGTGNAHAVDLYNTCFAFTEGSEHFLVDAGGGNGILRQLRSAGIDYKKIRTMFITHNHTDHVLGAIWIIRKIGEDIGNGLYEGNFIVYGNDLVIEYLKLCYRMLIRAKEQPLLGTRIFLQVVEDGESKQIMNRRITFFDIHSTKAKQYGFTYYYAENKKLTCCGDEPYDSRCAQYALKSTWLFHEAFCLYNEREIFKPYEKKHTTVKEACQIAAELGVDNLVLYHTEETHGKQRSALYLAEGKEYFPNNLFVPEDLATIDL